MAFIQGRQQSLASVSGFWKSICALDFKAQLFLVSSLFLCSLSSAPEMAPVHLLIPPRNDKVPESFKKKRLCNDIQATWNRYFISKAVGSFSHTGTVPPKDPLAVWLRGQWEGDKAFSEAP